MADVIACGRRAAPEEDLRRGRPAEADRGVRLQERHGSADHREGRASTWAWAKRPHDTKKVQSAAADLALIAGQKPVITKARKAIADLQGAREHADRLQGDAAQDPDVRVPRPPGHHRAAARPRLPRPEPEVLRRPRQLRAGHQGAHRSSPRSTTTRSRPCGAWTSSSAPPPRPTTRRARCCAHFNFPFRQ